MIDTTTMPMMCTLLNKALDEEKCLDADVQLMWGSGMLIGGIALFYAGIAARCLGICGRTGSDMACRAGV